VPRDVPSSESVAKLGAAVASVGGADILIHDAGIYPMETLAERDVRVMPTVMAVNLDSMFLLRSFRNHGATPLRWRRAGRP
jgi:NAD(P)-dependent dehydrogenase (short-subunit alcohol dehydrogenase family)